MDRTSLVASLGLLVALGLSSPPSHAAAATAPPPAPAAATAPPPATARAAFISMGRRVELHPSRRWLTVELAPGASLDAARRRIAGAPGLGAHQIAASARRGGELLVRLDREAPDEPALAAAALALPDGGAIAAATPAVHTPDGQPLGLTARAVVVMSPGVDPASLAPLVRALGGRIDEALPFARALLVSAARAPDAGAVLALAERLRAAPGVLDAHPDFLRAAGRRRAPSDPLFPEQWYAARAGLPGALDTTAGSERVLLAVLDDGFDLDHEDLGGRPRISPEAWDFADLDADPSAGSLDDHGTPVAGIALAVADNGRGIAGLCPRCGFLPLRRGATDADDMKAIARAAEAGAHVINCSWGYTFPSTGVVEALRAAAQDARGGRGALVIFAAGNEGVDIDEAFDISALPEVVAVAATGPDDAPLASSNRGRSVDLAAPAGGMRTTDRTIGGFAAGPYARSFGGTSGAAPVVAGAAGLLFSLDPERPAAEVREILERTAAPVVGDDPADPAHGSGRVDVARAVAVAAGPREPSWTCALAAAGTPSAPGVPAGALLGLAAFAALLRPRAARRPPG